MSELDDFLLRAKRAAGKKLNDEERERLSMERDFIGCPNPEDGGATGYLMVGRLRNPDRVDGKFESEDDAIDAWAERFGGEVLPERDLTLPSRREHEARAEGEREHQRAETPPDQHDHPRPMSVEEPLANAADRPHRTIGLGAEPRSDRIERA